MDRKIAELEALLFIHGEPISYKKIESVLKVEREECESIIEALRGKLDDEARGLQLVVGNDKVQLATKPEFNVILEDFVKEELSEDLTPASLEALSIIAYLGPISRAKLEYLRGVNSLIILRSLMIRGLIERITDPEHPASFLYRPTFDLMKQLGLRSKEDLPEYAKFQDLLKIFQTETENKP